MNFFLTMLISCLHKGMICFTRIWTQWPTLGEITLLALIHLDVLNLNKII
jgi:hypothetical protein